ncbi:MAG TPA: CopD family protein [Methylovirgula sp.]
MTSDSLYLWIKALHVVAIIAFMAGMLYLPRLFVYHAGVAPGSAPSELFKTMERRLDLAIMRPALTIVILTGAALVWKGQWIGAAWLWAKLAFVAVLLAEYIFLIRMRGVFARDQNHHPPRLYKIVNEVGTLALIGIVIMVVIKPF